MNDRRKPAAPSPDDKLRKLFLRQVELLDTFLKNGAISRAQHEKSLSCMMQKMGFDRKGNRTQ
ncbi:MAG: hypothetical protein MJ025_00215 [Victivallaceae bacterium]|nr:hypothetical protein [Victivallaceae bacterium]